LSKGKVTPKLWELSTGCWCQADIDLRKGFDLTSTRRPRCREDIDSRLVQTIHYLRLYRSRHMLTVVSKQRVLPSCSGSRCSRSHVASRTWLLRFLFEANADVNDVICESR